MVWLKVCLNGDRRATEHPAVPVTAAQLEVAARDAVRAGADAVHLHPRTADGTESLRAADVAAAVASVRAGAPGVPVGVSTGLWITAGDTAERHTLVSGWAALDRSRLPDFASVNLSEPGWADLVTALGAAGIGAEAGVWSVADARTLAVDGSSVAPGWLRVLVEILDVPADQARTAADQVLAAVHQAAPRTRDDRAPVLLHGEGEACWPLVRHAIQLGLPTRIGLEDILTAPDGTPVRDNAHLVELATSLR